MPFGYSQYLRTWKCMYCKKVYHFKLTDKGAREYMDKTIEEHSKAHSDNDPQITLYGTKIDYYGEVKDRMKIPSTVLESGATKSGLQFIKAVNLGATENETAQATQIRRGQLMGKLIEFTVQGDVETSGQEPNVLYSVPVYANFNNTKLQGQYSLNKTALKILVGKLGDETTAWIGARYTSFIGPTRNPRSGDQTLGFSILADTVKTAKSR